jgi:uncharacterized membrane protein
LTNLAIAHTSSSSPPQITYYQHIKMAAEVGSAPVNGYGHGGATAGYGADYRSQNNHHQSAPSTASSTTAEVSKEQVAWYFVESYYTTMSQTPEKLHVSTDHNPITGLEALRMKRTA